MAVLAGLAVREVANKKREKWSVYTILVASFTPVLVPAKLLQELVKYQDEQELGLVDIFSAVCMQLITAFVFNG